MKTLIEIIKSGLSDFRADAINLISENIAREIESSGLLTPFVNFEFLPEKRKDEEMFKLAQEIINLHPSKGQFSDGYHTFNELYEIRKAYNVALFNEWASHGLFTKSGAELVPVKHDVHKSWRHHDGELCFGGGWFIVVAVLPSGQISNHYEASDWNLFKIPETETAKYEWDGHTTEDVINRLING